jgi:hypothetical protein
MSRDEVEVVPDGEDRAGRGARVAPQDERGRDVERRVHVDLPRVRPDEMVTSQPAEPVPDPYGGRDTETDFLLRNAGW